VSEYRKKHLCKLGYAQQCKFDWAIKKHLGPQFEAFKISEMTTVCLQDWFNGIEKALSKSSRTGLKNILSGIFERAIAWDFYNDRNPAEGVKIFGAGTPREKRKLEDAETRQYLAELPYDVRLLCSVCLFCGLRITEALALRPEHLDFDKGLILIRQSFYRGVLREEPKTGKGRRDVPMGYLVDDLKLTCPQDPNEYVFKIRTHPRKGTPAYKPSFCRDDRDLLQHFLRPLAKKLKFYWKGFGFRALRREAITEIGSVAGIGQAMQMAGHTHMDMSLLYTLGNTAKQEAAIKSFQERIIGKPQGPVQ
jgi:integrase